MPKAVTVKLTEPLVHRHEAEEASILFAAWNVDDALDGFHAESYPQGKEAAELRGRQSTLYITRGLFRKAAFFTLIFAFFEPPLWCDNSVSPYTRLPLVERCPLPHGVMPVESYSRLFMLPPFWAILVEAVLLFVMSLCVLQEKMLERAFAAAHVKGARHKGFSASRWAMVVGAMWVDLVIYYFVRQQSFRLAPFLRFILMFCCANVRQVFRAASRSGKEFGNIVMFMMGTCLFFAWFVTMVLDDIRDRRGASALSTIGGDNFGSFSAAFYSLFVIMTGAAFPDDIDDVIKNLRWLSLVFYVFMILSFFLFTQLMLAVVYSAYQNNVKEELTTYWKNRSLSLAQAFKAISQRGKGDQSVVKLQTFRKLVKQLTAFPKLKGVLKEENTQIIFQALDDDESGELSVSEFFDACYILQLTFWVTEEDSIFMRYKGESLAGVKDFITSGKLERCFNAILIANSVFIIYQSYLDIGNMTEPLWFDPANLFFSSVYMIDVLLKLLVYSFANYWASPENKFDLGSSITLFVIGMCTIFRPFGGASDDLLRYLNILRILKMGKLLMQVPRFNKMITCIVRLTMIAKDILALIFLTIYIFAVTGQQLFGGLLYKENPVLHGSDYVKNGFTLLNFNDLFGSIETLFTITVCNYMPEYTDAMSLVSKIPHSGMLFQGAYFFIGVSIVFNIFAAYTIDMFLELTQSDLLAGDDDQDEEGDDAQKKGSNGDDAQKKGSDDAESVGSKKDEDTNLERMRKVLWKDGKVLHISEPVQVMKMRMQTKILDGLEEDVKEVQDKIAPTVKRPILVA